MILLLFIKNLRIIIAEKELFGITRRKRLELCGLKQKWLAISSQIPNNSTRNSLILDSFIIYQEFERFVEDPLTEES
ncbi:MAG: hypothetical protein K6G32_09950 [Prevotella sp.]|nr:hypothetical protein [Prevotella sp.]